ncbi:hypothetical protein B5X24_HaOG203486 [Helicoverpa armigera]|uniref:Uncharacterized protein n=1 Tax=Helicoverpa armigera TaxID=29058 RepID=A0A2W1BVV1_HELAM|nr:hypothetical protein B5X24_HaOG203486 [Helicoverpa armigera]
MKSVCLTSSFDENASCHRAIAVNWDDVLDEKRIAPSRDRCQLGRRLIQLLPTGIIQSSIQFVNYANEHRYISLLVNISIVCYIELNI